MMDAAIRRTLLAPYNGGEFGPAPNAERRRPGALLLLRDSRGGGLMKRKAANSEHKPIITRPPRPKLLRARSGKDIGTDRPPRASKTPARAVVTRLAAEVDALAAQLEASRARITDLETRIDIDPLTDILNRRGFERELTRSLAYVKRYGTSAALVYLDLDQFKPVNDRHGHAAGDAVLKAVAAALVRQVRASDLVARIGGDEFVVLLWNVGGSAAAAKAAALEAAVYSTPVAWGASTLVVGASAGVAQLGALDSPADIFARADSAMYARKAERKDKNSRHPERRTVTQ
jgi:diguanylate cyclase (GGDEF)-like protein